MILFHPFSVGHDEVDDLDEGPEFDHVYPDSKWHPGHPHEVEDEEEEHDDHDEDNSSLAMAKDEQRGWLRDLQQCGYHIVQVTLQISEPALRFFFGLSMTRNVHICSSCP